MLCVIFENALLINLELLSINFELNHRMELGIGSDRPTEMVNWKLSIATEDSVKKGNLSQQLFTLSANDKHHQLYQ